MKKGIFFCSILLYIIPSITMQQSSGEKSLPIEAASSAHSAVGPAADTQYHDTSHARVQHAHPPSRYALDLARHQDTLADAAARGDAEQVSRLLELDVSQNELDYALLQAIRRENEDIASMVIKHGAGFTTFDFGSDARNQVIRYLKEHGEWGLRQHIRSARAIAASILGYLGLRIYYSIFDD